MLWQQTKEQREVARLTESHAQMGTFSGVVLVSKKDKVIFQKTYGAASLELSVALTPMHLFNIGSVSKMFTALAVLQLEAQGTLSTNDALSKYIPNFPDNEAILLHHLLSNTSGVPDYLILEGSKGWYALPHTPVELIEYIRHEPRLFKPGQDFGYSNSNWVLLVMIVEKVTSKPWAHALRDLVLDPFGLTKTVVGEASKVISGCARGYRLEEGKLVPALPINPSVEIGAGGIFSCVEDLLELEHHFLQSPLNECMIKPRGEFGGINYGYGIMSGKRFDRKWHGHSGGTFGFSSFLTCYPDDRVTIIVLSNLENGSAMQLEQDLAAVVFGEPYTLPGTRVFIQVASETLNTYSGSYRTEFMGRPMTFEVRNESKTLTVQFPLLPKTKLQAISETHFVGHLKGGEVDFHFNRTFALIISNEQM